MNEKQVFSTLYELRDEIRTLEDPVALNAISFAIIMFNKRKMEAMTAWLEIAIERCNELAAKKGEKA